MFLGSGIQCLVLFLVSTIFFEKRLWSEDSLKEHVTEFRVKNCPLGQCVNSLGAVGIHLCWEMAPITADQESNVWVDTAGRHVFSGPAYTFDAVSTTRESLLNQFVALLPEYTWVAVPNSNLVNLIPKSDSILNNHTGPYQGSGRIDEIANQVKELRMLRPYVPTTLPPVTLNFSGGTSREMLNALSIPNGGKYTWSVIWARQGNVLTWYGQQPDVDRVRMEYDIHSGVPIDESADFLESHYLPQRVRENGELILIPELKVLDLAVYNGSMQRMTSQQSERSGICYMALRALLKNDVDKFLEYCHPNGVQLADRLLNREELKEAITKYARDHSQSTVRLAHLVDPAQLTLTVEGNRLRYVIPVKAPLQREYGIRFQFTLEECADHQWRIVQMDL